MVLEQDDVVSSGGEAGGSEGTSRTRTDHDNVVHLGASENGTLA
jgi:hypothetical protein